MHSTLAAYALAAASLVSAAPQASMAGPAAGAPPPGCSQDYSQSFQITPINVTTSSGIGKRDLLPRQDMDGSLILNLSPNGDLKSTLGDTAYIASNFQFQFDNPVQAGALSIGGYSVCTNQTDFSTLGIGGTTIFWSCISGGFSNLYDRNWAPQCSPIKLRVLPAGGSSGSGSGSSGATTTADGQPTGATSAAGVTQTSDNQPQGPTSATGVTQLSDNQPNAPTSAAGVTQLSDNQPNAPTSAAAITQLSDNQPNAPTSAAAVSQQPDNQPTAPTAAPAVSQQPDNQPTAPTAAPAITQISDNQPQAPTAAGAVSQISDNQPQVPTAATPYNTPAPARYTGGAATNGLSHLALAGAAAVGVYML
ncbi:MAG: hypothetical protein Q9159_007222 [Coniocarpon cinnabarinum]